VNILGISGSIGWDGNWSMIDDRDYWVHGSGATLVIDGELKGALSEERMTRIKHDGNYPKNTIKKLLTENNLTNDDIDVITYVSPAVLLSYSNKLHGYLTTKLRELFPNARILTLDHHIAHAAAAFLTSGFEEANVFTFDGAGDFHPDQKYDQPKLNNTSFFNGTLEDKKLTNIHNTYIDENHTNLFGGIYSEYAIMIYEMKVNGIIPSSVGMLTYVGDDIDENTENYTKIMRSVLNIHSFDDFVDITDYNSKIKEFDLNPYDNPVLREIFPGKIMGLAAYGNHENLDAPDIFDFKKLDNDFPETTVNGKTYITEIFPEITVNKETKKHIVDHSSDYTPEDMAAWLQYNFEKYLLLILKNIPKKFKKKKLCLGGGCALNILTNSKIISEGIYEDVHVNTAPNDDGLSFGGAVWTAFRLEENLVLPKNQGCLGPSYSNEYIKTCLENYKGE
jgi:predicted NodU family carbamoyl transferase